MDPRMLKGNDLCSRLPHTGAMCLLDELLAPVDREVLARQSRYYSALQQDAAARPAAPAAPAGPAAADERNRPVPPGRNATDER